MAGAFLVHGQQILEPTADIHRRQELCLPGPKAPTTHVAKKWPSLLCVPPGKRPEVTPWRVISYCAQSTRRRSVYRGTLRAEKLRDYGANTIKAGSRYVVRATSIDNGQ